MYIVLNKVNDIGNMLLLFFPICRKILRFYYWYLRLLFGNNGRYVWSSIFNLFNSKKKLNHLEKPYLCSVASVNGPAQILDILSISEYKGETKLVIFAFCHSDPKVHQEMFRVCNNIVIKCNNIILVDILWLTLRVEMGLITFEKTLSIIKNNLKNANILNVYACRKSQLVNELVLNLEVSGKRLCYGDLGRLNDATYGRIYSADGLKNFDCYLMLRCYSIEIDNPNLVEEVPLRFLKDTISKVAKYKYFAQMRKDLPEKDGALVFTSFLEESGDILPGLSEIEFYLESMWHLNNEKLVYIKAHPRESGNQAFRLKIELEKRGYKVKLVDFPKSVPFELFCDYFENLIVFPMGSSAILAFGVMGVRVFIDQKYLETEKKFINHLKYIDDSKNMQAKIISKINNLMAKN